MRQTMRQTMRVACASRGHESPARIRSVQPAIAARLEAATLSSPGPDRGDERTMTTLTSLLLFVVVSGATAAQDAPPSDAPVAPPLARIHGRLVDGAGAPIAEGVLLMRAYPRMRARSATAPSTLAPAWRPPTPVVTGADGRFELAFDPPETHLLRVELNLPGYERRGWRWDTLAPGAEVALGDITLRPGKAIVGHIVDPDGNLLSDGWSVVVWPMLRDPASDPAIWPASVAVDPKTGLFRVEGFPAGEVRVSARTRGIESTDERRFTLEDGAETTIELVYAGPQERTSLLLDLTLPPGAGIGPASGTVRAVGPDGAEVVLERHMGPTNLWFAAPKTEGPFRVVVDDARFRRASLDGLGIGQTRPLTLVGSATVALEVLDEVDGSAVLDFDVAITYRGTDAPRSPQRLSASGVNGGNAVRSFEAVPGDIVLHVSSPRHPVLYVEVGVVGPGESRTARVVLAPPTTLRGVVVDAHDVPVDGATIELTQGAIHGHDLPSQGVLMIHSTRTGERQPVLVPYRDHVITTDADGGFRVEGLARGQWAVHVSRGPFVHLTELRVLAPDEAWRLTLAATTEATFQLTGLEGRAPSAFTLRLLPLGSGPIERWPPEHLTVAQAPHLVPDALGRFGPVLVPLGAQQVTVTELRARGNSTTRHNVWQSIVDITPDLELELDLSNSARRE